MKAEIPKQIDATEAEQNPSLIVAAHEPDTFAAAAETLADRIREHGKSVVWVEGYMGSGKTPLAWTLANALSWPAVHLDNLLIGTRPNTRSYVDQIVPEKLDFELGTAEKRRQVVIDGVCLRWVLENILDRKLAFVVYVASMVKTPEGKLVWQDGIAPSRSSWMKREVDNYHSEELPHKDFDIGVLRIHEPWKKPI